MNNELSETKGADEAETAYGLTFKGAVYLATHELSSIGFKVWLCLTFHKDKSNCVLDDEVLMDFANVRKSWRKLLKS